MLANKSIMKRPRNTKIGVKVTHLLVSRSKVKVTWSITLHNNTSFRTTIAFYSHSRCKGGDTSTTGRANKNRTPKRTLLFRFTCKWKLNGLLHVKEQSVLSVYDNFNCLYFYTSKNIIRFVKLPCSNENTMLRHNDIMFGLWITNYAVHIQRKKMFY